MQIILTILVIVLAIITTVLAKEYSSLREDAFHLSEELENANMNANLKQLKIQTLEKRLKEWDTLYALRDDEVYCPVCMRYREVSENEK